jgi:hypothetical protein
MPDAAAGQIEVTGARHGAAKLSDLAARLINRNNIARNDLRE